VSEAKNLYLITRDSSVAKTVPLENVSQITTKNTKITKVGWQKAKIRVNS